MTVSYEVTREQFDQIIKDYAAYLQLFRYFNGGSVEGCTPFGEFYWTYIYHSKHSPDSLSRGNNY